jgi:hypothetical protein
VCTLTEIINQINDERHRIKKEILDIDIFSKDLHQILVFIKVINLRK